MSKIAINTSQNVNINFNIASIGDRILAFFIDMIIKAAYLIALFVILYKVLNVDNMLKGWDDWTVMAFFGIITLPVHLYTLVCESLMEGQTFGKKIMRIRVVKIDGYQASFGDYFIRWIFRIVDIFSCGGIVGLITVIGSKNNQRFGGMVSGTAVISLKNQINISHTILENLQQDYVPEFPQVVLLSDNDMRIIKSNFQKAVVTYDKIILRQLANKIKEILKLEIDHRELTEKQFRDKIIKDYNYYTGKE